MSSPSRYARIYEEIRRLRAVRLLEVGTWNGDRAVAMIRAAAAASPKREIRYYGFDLFEGMDAEKSKAEFNVKAPSAMAAVEARLMGRELSGIKASFRLFKGDTKSTLPKAAPEIGEATVDIAWIDGGHSVATVLSDWTWCAKLIRKGGVSLLDDHYSEMPEAEIARFGCNRLIKDLERTRKWDGRTIRSIGLLPEADPVRGGGTVRIARVEFEG